MPAAVAAWAAEARDVMAHAPLPGAVLVVEELPEPVLLAEVLVVVTAGPAPVVTVDPVAKVAVSAGRMTRPVAIRCRLCRRLM